ncbi:MAG: hypothetical protein V1823_00120, partial [Chloroflexota bacterium]
RQYDTPCGKPRAQITSFPRIYFTPHIAAYSFTHGQSPWNSALRVIRSIWALRARRIFVADNPQILREDWWPLEPTEAKIRYWGSVEKAFKTNYEAVNAKGKALQLIVPLLGIEVISLIAWLFLL